MKPYGKEPFSFKSDPDYLEEKQYKLQKLQEKMMIDQLNIVRDKYGNIIKKHNPTNKPYNKQSNDFKNKRYQDIVMKEAKSQQKNKKNGYVHTKIQSNYSNKKVQGQIRRSKIQKQMPINKNFNQKSETKHNKNQQNKNKSQKCSEFLYQKYGGVNGPDSHLIEMLERDIIVPSNGITMDDIADLKTAKSLLQQAVLLPILLPNLFQGIRKPWKGILMFGPPGTGKTMLARAIAQTGKVKFFNISASALASKWRGQSEKLMRILFQMARFYAPSIIFMDEIDSIASKRSDNDSEASRRVKTQLLIQIDGAGSASDKPVMLLAATNHPWDLDQALRRRLQKRIYIPLPTQIGRKQLFINNTKQIKLDPNVDFDYLVDKTKGFSGADIIVLIRSASYLPLRRYLKKNVITESSDIDKIQKEVQIPITTQDFIQALKGCNASVGQKDLGKYEQWMNEFGST